MEQLFKEPFPQGRKILYFDVETTGLNAVENGIIQLAGIVEIDGKVQEEFNFNIKTFPDDKIEDKALEVHGNTRDDIASFPEPLVVYHKLTAILMKYVYRYKKNKTFADKFYPAGYRVLFDIDFLNEWFVKCGDKYFGSWQNWHSIDALQKLYEMELKGLITLPNYKLDTVCKHFGIEINAHDALSDIRATRELICEIVL